MHAKDHVDFLFTLGILVENTGHEIRLLHQGVADTKKNAQGLLFMQDMIRINQEAAKEREIIRDLVAVEIAVGDSHPSVVLGGPAAFGPDVVESGLLTTSDAALTSPRTACSRIDEPLKGKIAVVQRGECMFVDKVSLLLTCADTPLTTTTGTQRDECRRCGYGCC